MGLGLVEEEFCFFAGEEARHGLVFAEKGIDFLKFSGGYACFFLTNINVDF